LFSVFFNKILPAGHIRSFYSGKVPVPEFVF